VLNIISGKGLTGLVNQEIPVTIERHSSAFFYNAMSNERRYNSLTAAGWEADKNSFMSS
jgi:hypothetical protein